MSLPKSLPLLLCLRQSLFSFGSDLSLSSPIWPQTLSTLAHCVSVHSLKSIQIGERAVPVSYSSYHRVLTPRVPYAGPDFSFPVSEFTLALCCLSQPPGDSPKLFQHLPGLSVTKSCLHPLPTFDMLTLCFLS